VKPLWLAVAALLLAGLVWRFRRLSNEQRIIGVVLIAAAAVYGSGVVHLPSLESVIEDAGRTLGKWTYLLVAVLAFLETGAFVGLIAPGEFTIILGGFVAGQGHISIVVLIGIVWTAAVLGDTTSYWIGRRLGREFLVKHGPKVKITEDRIEQVERFFAKRGGATILIGRFVGLVRALAPFVAGASKFPYGRFLPYDVIGAGVWASFFCILGYIFWQSFDKVVEYAKKGSLALGTVIVVVVGGIWAYRWLRCSSPSAGASPARCASSSTGSRPGSSGSSSRRSWPSRWWAGSRSTRWRPCSRTTTSPISTRTPRGSRTTRAAPWRSTSPRSSPGSAPCP
jgi:undecaprenyl-diphosphatase